MVNSFSVSVYQLFHYDSSIITDQRQSVIVDHLVEVDLRPAITGNYRVDSGIVCLSNYFWPPKQLPVGMAMTKPHPQVLNSTQPVT